jgi:hypothetical protein
MSAARSLLKDDRLCEGFRMTPHHEPIHEQRGRRPKPSRKGTRRSAMLRRPRHHHPHLHRPRRNPHRACGTVAPHSLRCAGAEVRRARPVSRSLACLEHFDDAHGRAAARARLSGRIRRGVVVGLDAIATLFAKDGQFVNAGGASAFGDRYSGPRDIRDYFAELFAKQSQSRLSSRRAELDLRKQGRPAVAPHGNDASR